MIVVASANARVGIAIAVEILARGGSALDAVEACIHLVEDNVEDQTVGSGGLPNLLGEVELDASIMDGRTRAAGAVAALRGYPNPISVARRVMRDLPHVMLSGDGAARFAAEAGFLARDPLTDTARDLWQRGVTKLLPEGTPHEAIARQPNLIALARAAADPEFAGGTVNVIAQDLRGDIAAGASTSGWAWKYPGRTGDTPVIGAGCYADNRYGAACCTGRGEMALRAVSAHSVVMAMRFGLSLESALVEAQRDLWTLDDPFYGPLSIIAIDRDGRPAAISNIHRTFIYQTPDMPEPVERDRIRIERPDPLTSRSKQRSPR